LQQSAIVYLLERQKDRKSLESRAALSVFLASGLLGGFMAWLVGNPSVALPWADVTCCCLLILVRSMSDAAMLFQMVIGGAWREIRLSRLRPSQVVLGILRHGLEQQLIWGVGPALLISGLAGFTYGLAWFWGLVLGSILASLMGMLSVVQRWVGRPRMTRLQLAGVLTGLLVMVILSQEISLGVLAFPLHALVTFALGCLVSDALERIPEGHLMPTEVLGEPRQRRWLPFSENPIVARECARESVHLGNSALSTLIHFAGWGLLLASLPAAYMGLTYWAAGEQWPAWVKSSAAAYLSAYVLLAGLFQAVRAAVRVFRALGEERDRQTLDLLVVTALDPEDFVDGWAAVGYTTRQLEMSILIVASLGLAFCWQPPLVDLALVLYSGLLGWLFCQAGAYCGLVLGFRHCAREKPLRHMLYPLGIFCWVVATAPLLYLAWGFLAGQAVYAWLLARHSRKLAMLSLQG